MGRIAMFTVILAMVFVAAFAVGRALEVSPPGADDAPTATHTSRDGGHA